MFISGKEKEAVEEPKHELYQGAFYVWQNSESGKRTIRTCVGGSLILILLAIAESVF
jgi:hypothetical protein